MSFDAILNVLGLILSVAGIIVAKPGRRPLTISLFAAVGIAAAVALVITYQRSAELQRIEEKINVKLEGNVWTEERIVDEIQVADKRLVGDALLRAADAGTIGEKKTTCVSNDGNVLTTRVFYRALSQ